MLDFAVKLTTHPSSVERQDLDRLRSVGFDDAAIHDIVQVTALFNYYDRLAEGVVHVPLVFGGGRARGLDSSACERPVSTLDIAPTILDLCGIQERPETFLGITLNDTRPRPVYGQTFYDGADNRCSDRPSRAFELKPFPAPVRECCKQMFFRIEGDYQVIHDAGTGRTEVNRLKSARSAPGHSPPPDPETARMLTEAYLEGVYRAPEQSGVFDLSRTDAKIVEARLHDLGYI